MKNYLKKENVIFYFVENRTDAIEKAFDDAAKNKKNGIVFTDYSILNEGSYYINPHFVRPLVGLSTESLHTIATECLKNKNLDQDLKIAFKTWLKPNFRITKSITVDTLDSRIQEIYLKANVNKCLGVVLIDDIQVDIRGDILPLHHKIFNETRRKDIGFGEVYKSLEDTLMTTMRPYLLEDPNWVCQD